MSNCTGNIADKLNLLIDTKLRIKEAIEERNIEVGDIPFSQYPDKIRLIDCPPVEGEVLTYDNRNTNRKAIDTLILEGSDLTNAKKAIDQALILKIAQDLTQGKRAIEDINSDIIANLTEANKKSVEIATGAIAAQAQEVGKKATTIDTISITTTQFADELISNTGFINPNNLLNDTTNTAAVRTVSSSGLLGLTSNTVTGAITVRMKALEPDLEQLNIIQTVLFIERSAVITGGPVGGNFNIALQVSTDGINFTTFTTINAAVAKGFIGVDITGIVGNNWNIANNIVFRATGSITSGAGLGVSRTVNLFRSVVVNIATEDY